MMMRLTKSGPPAIGQPWQGGYYIGNITDGGVLYALVLAPKAAGQNNSLQWKTANTATAGTASTTNGWDNTNAMNNATHPAAQFCRGLRIGGFADWYLPAKDELNVIYTNRSSISGEDSIDVDTEYYWSSTESSATFAWDQRFSAGNQNVSNKTVFLRLRAVRRVAIG